MPKRLIHSLAKGEPLSVIWPYYVSFGAICFGCFSIPSSGAAIVLIPMFLIAGLVIGFSMLTHRWDDGNPCTRYLVVTGLALMLVASWTRAISVWGVDQNGAGSNILASVVWIWITIGIALLMIAVWVRGLS